MKSCHPKRIEVLHACTLALGIGANRAIFALWDKGLIRPLSDEQPQQLVIFVKDVDGALAIFSYPLYAKLRDHNDVLSGMAAALY